MAGRVARRAKRRKAAQVAAARRRAAQRRVRAELRVEVAGAVKATVERALRREVTEVVGRERYERRATAGRETTAARCSGCGANWSPRFWRAGSYRRTLLTVAAAVELRVPRVGCICGGTVPLEFAAVGRYERCWGDLQERARELAGLCLSLADAREVLAADSGQPVAASTLNGWVRQADGLAEALRRGPLERVPAVVLLDGVWVKLLAPTGEWFVDKQGRRRERVKRAKAAVLVAYGVDPATGERWVLDWERAEREDEASWRRLLERLLERGLRADAGLELVIHDGGSGLEAALGTVHFGRGVLQQRCVFHVLRNVRDALRGEPGMDREAKRERRAAVLQDAAAIWQTTERAEVYRRREAFRQAWAEREPAAVATLERAFPATLAYLAALERGRERGEVWQARYLRTTSALERVNRAIRQKARQVGAFKAEAGLTAALGLVFAHRGLHAPTPADDLWTEVLEAGLLAAAAR
jgi:transposase-like protein